jgi:replicative DNA helicase
MYVNGFDRRFDNYQYNRVYQEAESQYFNTKGMTIVEASGEIGALQIRKIVGDYINYKQRKPVIIVDYLQILAPYSKEYARDIRLNIDKTILELKRIARDYKIPVIAVSSLNRTGAKEKVTEDAFKESGAIEYSCDVLLGLHKRNDIKQPIREMELVILKNRIGQANKEIYYDYNAGFHHFEEVEKTDRQAI